MNETTEHISSPHHPPSGCATDPLLAWRGRQGESPGVLPLLYVALDVDAKKAFEVTASLDEDVVEALRADRAHEPRRTRSLDGHLKP